MIIRKPYAFLIKNFRKIHIFLLILCGYLFFKNSQIRSFVSEFLSLGSYDMYNEPISRYISPLVIISLLIAIGLFTTLIVLLRHKGKPWKLYLIPALEYLFMLIIFGVTTSFFNNYKSSSGTTGIRAIKDLLTIVSLFQYPVILILLIRIFGVDINKFDFKTDKEYLELSSEDREEFEINIDIDKESFKRTYKRFLRNAGYVYEEHKFIVNSLIGLATILFIGFSYKYVFIDHKSYKEGQVLNSSGYSIRINHSYYTNKDYNGKVISNKNNFVIIDASIKNNAQKRNINFSRFHVMNKTNNYSYTFKTYETDFIDLGKTYEKKEISRGEEVNLIMIFKVDKKLDKNRFVLYYQEFNNGKPYLRKIKLNIEDISVIKDSKAKELGDDSTIKIGPKETDLIVDEAEVMDSVSYSYQDCENSGSGCQTSVGEVSAKSSEKILQIGFVSDSFEGKDLIDFSTKYGKIIYIDDKGNKHSVKIKSAVDKKYMGQYMYIRVPSNLDNYEDIRLVYTVRNNRYTYKLK
ncbi:MAG: hypothetical protein E7160_01395 [Firmicutes bacterium]|nr:hypothetical protein [Bacillota bacterium]